MAGSSLVAIPKEGEEVFLEVEGRRVRLSNLAKSFWPGITKGDLLQYYADVAPALLPHLRERAMVMRRYPDGHAGASFFMKRAPKGKPEWVPTVAIEHGSGSVIDFPVVNDLPTLLWVVNLGCIDLNPWYSRRDDPDRPDFLHFDLDPGEGATWETVRAAALAVRAALEGLGMTAHVKTTGSRGVHVYVAIERGPIQKDVWTVAKALALKLAREHPAVLTAEYRKIKRPKGRVVVDYNQNAWGRTLASVYSVRPTPLATVSTPLEWRELEAGAKLEDFRLGNVPERVRARGDLWAPLAPGAPGRFDLARLDPGAIT